MGIAAGNESLKGVDRSDGRTAGTARAGALVTLRSRLRPASSRWGILSLPQHFRIATPSLVEPLASGVAAT